MSGLLAELTLGDGGRAVAPFAETAQVPAAGALCIIRADGILEPARFVRVRTLPGDGPSSDSTAESVEFVSVATRSESERALGNAEALERVRAASRKWFADEGREALVMRFRFSLRRERLTMTVSCAGFVDLRPLREALEKRFQTTLSVRAVSPRRIAASLGGIGSCGRMLCCASGICSPDGDGERRFPQGVSRDPNASGVCGRLRCCLLFEGEN